MQDKDMLIKRLNRIEGQVKGIQKMVDEERYCIDILTQISAIRSAINKVGSIILENHIKGCVVNSIKEDNSEESIEELMKTIDKFINQFVKSKKNLGCVSNNDILLNPTIFTSKYKQKLLNLSGDKGGKKIILENLNDLFTFKILSEKEVIDIAIKPEVVDPDDIEMLQDLVLSAVNEALRSVDEMQASQMSKVTGGMNIPGLF